MEEEERHVGIDVKHSDEVIENNQVESEFLKCFLEASEYDDFIKDIEHRLFWNEIKVQEQKQGKDIRVVVRIQQLQREDKKHQLEDNW